MQHDYSEDIFELNMSFLMLAQKMARENFAAATVKLGIDAESLTAIMNLSPQTLIRLAQRSKDVPQFRHTGDLLRKLAGEHKKDETAAQLHAMILATRFARKSGIENQRE